MIYNILIGVILGGSIGILMGSTRSCESGGCPLTANPLRGGIYGSVMGLLLALSFGTAATPTGTADKQAVAQQTQETSESEVKTGAKALEVVELTDGNFDSTVASGTVLVDFWATWCGPCQMQAPILEAVRQKAPADVTIGKLEVDTNSATAGRYRVQSIPTLILFRDGKEVQRLVGVQSEAVLLRLLTN